MLAMTNSGRCLLLCKGSPAVVLKTTFQILEHVDGLPKTVPK